MAGEMASQIGQGIGRIADDEEQRLRRYRNDFGNNIPVEARIGFEELQPASGVAAVRGAPRFFVDAGRDDHKHCVGKVGGGGTTSTPEPGGLLSLSAGVAALAGLRRMRAAASH